MKFGKRHAKWVAEHQPEASFSYSRFKASLADDIGRSKEHAAAGLLQPSSHSWDCDRVLLEELHAFSAYIDAKTAALEQHLHGLSARIDRSSSQYDAQCEARASELAQEVRDVLNQGQLTYIAVVKAAKKRNRHLTEAFGAVKPLHALELLANEAFFNSPRLAQLSTRTEILAQQAQRRQLELQEEETTSTSSSSGSTSTSPSASRSNSTSAKADPSQLLANWECPICLEPLYQPVVLTCAHRFCRGCAANHAGHCNDQNITRRWTQQSRSPNSSPGKQQSSGDGSSKSVSNDGSMSAPAQAPQPHAMPPWALGTFQMMEEDLHDVDSSRVAGEQEFFACPLCRKAQVLDLNSLQVDAALNAHIMELRRLAGVKDHAEASWGLLPPQLPQHKGKMTVLLDLDGTLITSFPPKRAPNVPPSMRTHHVGIGSKLNPLGVFVVERPELQQFLHAVSEFAEIVVYTAGFEDYAKPIVDAIDPQRKYITHTLYRDATLATEHYQCVKDMNRLNRPLERTVLVDDTPLAFLHQPDNGIPMLAYRGTADDRLLLEAVLPLLKGLSEAGDVQPPLRKRFGMSPWFKRRGLPIESIKQRSALAAALEREHHGKMASRVPDQVPPAVAEQPAPQQQQQQCVGGASAQAAQEDTVAGVSGPGRYMFVTDFDKTLVDFDAGERVVEEIAPELLPMLMGVTTNFIPITNDILREAQRRGVTRDQLLQCLKELGADVPKPTLSMLRTLKQQGVEARILSDCNSVFISHILAGAGPDLRDCFQEVLTNPASFQDVGAQNQSQGGASSAEEGFGVIALKPESRSNSSDSKGSANSSSSKGSAASSSSSRAASSFPSSSGSSSKAGSGSNWLLKGLNKLLPSNSASSKPLQPSSPFASSQQSATAKAPSLRAQQAQALVIKPAQRGHGCARCPENLCKGSRIRAMKQAGALPIIYAGDGSNDICAALALDAQDVLLARKGYPLGNFVEAQTREALRACVLLWQSHEELESLVRQLVVHA